MNMRSVCHQSHRLMVGYTPFGIVTILFSAPDTDNHGVAALAFAYGC